GIRDRNVTGVQTCALPIFAIGVGFLISFVFIDRIFNFVFNPSRKVLPAGVRFVYNRPAEAFSLYIQLALISGALIAAPAVMYQRSEERRVGKGCKLLECRC